METKSIDVVENKNNEAKYIYFCELQIKRNKKNKLIPIDIITRKLDNKYHSNIYDPPLGVLEEDNCIVNTNFFVKTHDNFIIFDIGYRERIPENKDFFCETKKITEPHFLLGGDTNYYHFLLNWIPRLFVYEMTNLDIPILLNNFSSKQKEICCTLFPHIKKIIRLNNTSRFKKLYIPNFFINPIHSPFAISNIRNRVVSLYYNELRLPKFSQYVYISREKSTRKVANEDELINSINKFGFKKYVLEDLDFLDQINLFYHAQEIISPHGAGLANLIFCNKKPKVLEIINDYYTKVFLVIRCINWMQKI